MKMLSTSSLIRHRCTSLLLWWRMKMMVAVRKMATRLTHRHRTQ